MKKTIIWCLVFVLCLLFVLPSDSYASGQAVKDYFTRGPSSASLDRSIDTVSSGIYVVLKLSGIILAVCLLVTIAISYMIATPGKRAKLKEQLIYYFVGVIFLLAGTAFLSWYEDVAHNVADSFAGSSAHANP